MRRMQQSEGTLWMLMILVALLAFRVAKADQITDFSISGSALSLSGESLGTCGPYEVCAFSGSMAVDITLGSITSFNVKFPGLSGFSAITAQTTYVSGWSVNSTNSSNDSLDIEFSTYPGLNTLVGFTGGAIDFVELSANPGPVLYRDTGGGVIAPIQSAAPEPGSLSLLIVGMLGAGFFASRRKRRVPPGQ